MCVSLADKFYKWVMSLPEDSSFDKHSIFYDEDRADLYAAPQAEADILSVPYLRYLFLCFL